MKNRYGAALLVSTLTYEEGEFDCYIAVVNQSPDDLVLRFPTTQRFDFALKDHKGQEYWRWSTEQEFDQVEEHVVVKGGEEGGFYVFDLPLDSLPLPQSTKDYVTLVGQLTSTTLPFTAEMRINLKV